MSVLSNLRDILPELSKNERKVADYLLKYPNDVMRFSCEAIATTSNTNRNAVIRLCHKMGYKGYSELKYAMLHEPQEPQESSSPEDNVLNYYCNGLQQLAPFVGSALLSDIADAISYAHRIVAIGMHHSAYSAKQFAFRLNRIGIDCFYLDDATQMSAYERILKQGDVAVIFSISAMQMYEEIVREYRRNRVKVILITMSPDTNLARLADYVAALPFLSHSTGAFLLDDAVTFFTFIEILVEALNGKMRRLSAGPGDVSG